MGLYGPRKLLLALVVTACVFSVTAEACSWSWGSDQSGSNWSWGWGSNNANGGSSSDSNSGGGSSWGWGWSSGGTDTNWGWGSSSGSNHSSGTGSTRNSHHNHTATSNYSSGTSSTHNNHTVPLSPRRKIVVIVWKSGFDYTEWASKHAPFYVNDAVVFKYNNNQTQSTMKHKNKIDVYLLPDLRSYKRCDVNRGKRLVTRGDSSSSSSGAFKLLLRETQHYYFASGDHSGCNHNMKFSLSPIPRPSSHVKP